MVKWLSGLLVTSVLVGVSTPVANAQTSVATNACGTQLGTPAALPAPGSPPFVWTLELCFAKQGGSSTVENETYLYWIKLKDLVSRPSQGVFVPYDEAAEKTILEDFKRLWGTNFLENLSMEVTDHTFE